VWFYEYKTECVCVVFELRNQSLEISLKWNVFSSRHAKRANSHGEARRSLALASIVGGKESPDSWNVCFALYV